MTENVFETRRLCFRRLTSDDAPFILELLNEPSWLRFIGDKGVRTLDDAQKYITNGPVASYEQHGFGLYLSAIKDSGIPIGICGLIKRDTLADVDVGFAFLERFWGNGYAVESAAAAVDHGRRAFGLTRVVAITAPDNAGSIRVLEKIGLEFETKVRLSGDAIELALYSRDLRAKTTADEAAIRR